MITRDTEALLGSMLATELRAAVGEVAAAFGLKATRVGQVADRIIREAVAARLKPSAREALSDALTEELEKQQAEAREKLSAPAGPVRLAAAR